MTELTWLKWRSCVFIALVIQSHFQQLFNHWWNRVFGRLWCHLCLKRNITCSLIWRTDDNHSLFSPSGCLKVRRQGRLRSWKPWCAISEVSLRSVGVPFQLSNVGTIVYWYTIRCSIDIYSFLLLLFSTHWTRNIHTKKTGEASSLEKV